MEETVVFVDDELNVLNSIKRLFLATDSDVEYVFTDNVDRAVDIVGKHRVAVIVSDNIMPEKTGVDLLAQVAEISPDTVKIMMTGYSDMATVIDAINKGGVFKFIMKPWENNDLIKVVNESVMRYRAVHYLRKSDEATLLSLAQTIELKDTYTRGHCDRVAQYALAMADQLGIDKDMQREIRYGSWLHDCGKIGISEEILNKKGPLTEQEYELIKKHPEWGADVARKAQLSQTVINIILFHHERFDGTGYPTGIMGKDIPLEARIVSIADVFDALTTDRSYRGKYDLDRALKILLKIKGSSFDPNLVDTFMTLADGIFKPISRTEVVYGR